MQIILVGINHKTASVDVRQQLAFDTPLVGRALRQLKADFPDGEFVLLSTCNRVECYAAVSKDSGPGPAALAQWLARFRGVDYAAVREAFYFKTDSDVAAHLFTVTSSLDSMVIGENQITFQVKESYKQACRCSAAGKILNHLFHAAFRTTKTIVSGTSIFNRRVSVAGVAVDLAKRLPADLPSARVVIAGAGQMAELLVEHLRHAQCRAITVLNRTEKRGCQLAEKHDVTRKPWEYLDAELAGADIFVAAASTSDGYLFDRDRVAKLMTQRDRRPLLIIDIAVPRCLEPAAGDVPGVHLYSIDDLAQVARDNIKLRQGDLEKAIEIICEAVAEFMDWFAMRDVGPLIGQIKQTFEELYEIEKEKFRLNAEQSAGSHEPIDALHNRMINKLCHRVIKNINVLSKEHGPDEAEKFARELLTDAENILSGHQRSRRV